MNHIKLHWLEALGIMFLVGLIIIMSGCQTTAPADRQALAACTGLDATVKSMTKIKPTLAVATQQKIGLALKTAASFCDTSAPPTDPNAAVAGILAALNTLAAAEAKTNGAPK